MDKLVSELMILVNCEWGGELDRAGPAIYRAQTQGKVKMITTAQTARRPGRGAVRLVQLRRCAARWTLSTSASWWR